MTIRKRWHSPMGDILLQVSSTALTGLWFFDQKYVPADFEETRVTAESVDPAATILRSAIGWLEQYYSEEGSDADRPALAPAGTQFQQTVWNALLSIPYGQAITYGELAQDIGKPSAVRAVAAAVGRNRVSLAIPCHRVIGANGSLTGYAGGLERKAALLEREHASAVQLQLV